MKNLNQKFVEILQTASELFQQKGYKGTSLQEIADAVGIQKPSLYYYIQKKEDLLFLILEKTTSCYIEQLEQIVQSEASAYVKLDRAIRQHILLQMAQAGTVVLFRDASSLEKDRQLIISSYMKKYRDLFHVIIEDGVIRGELYVEDPSLATVLILGACNFVHRWYKPDGCKNIEEIAMQFSQMLLSGMSLSYGNPTIGAASF